MNAVPQTPIASVLSEYDFIVVVDASGSMSTKDAPGGRSRWDYIAESVGAFAREIEAIDTDGLGFVLFSGTSIEAHPSVKADRIADAFVTRGPRGSTPLAEALTKALELAGRSAKKDFVIVFTDGTPDDQAAAADVIRKAANSSPSDDALTILFVQVGRDAAATSYLRQLDDQLGGCKFDIVDARTIEEAERFATVSDLVIAAIND